MNVCDPRSLQGFIDFVSSMGPEADGLYAMDR